VRKNLTSKEVVRKNKMSRLIVFSILIISTLNGLSQYAPAAQKQGSTAIFADSSLIDSWANYCKVTRSFVNISDPNYEYNGSNKASYGYDYDALGKADNIVVSLGDGGCAILSFESEIENHTGYDFAVFENSFTEDFLELAFVEVSSDGEKFVRFPSISLTQTNTQIGAFDNVGDASKINNLAGKYRALYGTPFDLEDLKDSSGIDLQNVTHIRIIDVIGSISDEFASYDSQGNKINDPFPTPYHTSGFDLDAVAILKPFSLSAEVLSTADFSIYPNPFTDFLKINSSSVKKIKILDLNGKLILEHEILSNSESIDLSFLDKGIYLLKLEGEFFSNTKKIIKN